MYRPRYTSTRSVASAIPATATFLRIAARLSAPGVMARRLLITTLSGGGGPHIDWMYRRGREMDSLAKMFGLMTSIMVGACGFMLILLFAGLYLYLIELALGPVDDSRYVFAGGLLLGFALSVRSFDAFTRWFTRGS